MDSRAPGTAGAGREAVPVALVTGSSGGVGRAVVERLAAEGWNVVGADVDPQVDADAPHRFVEADLEHPEAIEELIGSVEQREGRLDALVNVAAVQHCRPLESTDVELWDRVLAVNLRAPFLCLREALPLLRASRGAVVSVSSVHARHTSPEMASYAASKGGLEALTRAAAVELAHQGVRVNAVVPGAVDTPMLRAGLRREHLSRGSDAADPVDTFAERQPLGRVAEPGDVAQAVLYLVDSERSGFVTGTCLVVDGGVSARLSSE